MVEFEPGRFDHPQIGEGSVQFVGALLGELAGVILFALVLEPLDESRVLFFENGPGVVQNGKGRDVRDCGGSICSVSVWG